MDNVTRVIKKPANAYARAPANNPWVKDARLATRNGYAIGNGRIVSVFTDDRGNEKYKIITDAGNVAVFELEELRELFYQPAYLVNETPLECALHELAILEDRYKLYPGAWCCDWARSSNGWYHYESCKNWVLCL